MQTIIKQTDESPDAAVIWLHGLGADGSDFVPTLPYLNLPEQSKIRFIFPNAPVQPVTINGGMSMPSWYDILAMLPQRVTDEAQLAESVQSIKEIVEEQVDSGIDASRIIVIGFSQGGAVAYEVALTSGFKLAGVACMSTYLPRMLDAQQCKAEKNLDMLVIHGTRDDVVPCELGERSVAHLKALGYQPKWSSFPMAHEVSLESLSLLGEWITDQFNRRN